MEPSESDLLTGLMDDLTSSAGIQEVVDIVEPLRTELSLLRDKGLREFVSLMLCNAPFIWTSPSTNLADIHPPDEYDVGGLILHIKRSVRAAFVLATVYPLHDDDIQVLLAAAILHCVAKPMLPNNQGDPFTPDMYDNHYMISFDTFIQNAIESELMATPSRMTKNALDLDQEIISRIARLVHCCEGTFSPIDEIYPQDPLEILMASANLVAKSIHLIIDGPDIVEKRWDL